MALVCQCPTCGLFVMSPPEASTEDEVRCPHCAATFTLGNAVEVSLPKLIRVQQKRQKSDAIIHDTAEDVPWALWAELVVDETSLDQEAANAGHKPEISSPEVHVIESEASDEGSFLATVTPTPDDSVHDDERLFEFIIEGEEASKIFSKRELELAAQQEAEEAAKKEAHEFDLAFDETLLEDDAADHKASAKTSADESDMEDEELDMFDFEAESGELGPGEFNFEPTEPEDKKPVEEIPLAKLQKPQPQPVMPNPMAMVVSRLEHHGRRKSRTVQALLIGTAGLFLMAIAYYGLNFFGGSEFDLLGIPLPGCPHTYEKRAEVVVIDPQAAEAATKEQLKRDLAKLQSKPTPSQRIKTSLTESRIALRPIQNEESNANASSGQTGTGSTKGANQTQTASVFVDPDLFIPHLKVDQPRDEYHLAKGEIGLISYPLFDVRELESTLNSTHEEFGCPQCQSTGYLLSPDGEKIECDFCNGEPANMLTTMCYRYFCQLGQVATLFNDNSPRATEAKRQVKEILKKVIPSEREYTELAQLTLTRMEKPFHPYEGIILTGLVRVVKPSNGLYGAVIGLPDSNQRITVISDKPFDFEAGDRIVLLGAVILDPAKNISGFDANKPWVIWYGDSITLPETLPPQK